MDINSVSETIQSTLKTLESNPIIPIVASGGLTVWIITNLKLIYRNLKDFIVSLISFCLFNSYEDNRGTYYSIRQQQLMFNKIVSDSTAIWERNKLLDLNDETAAGVETQDMFRNKKNDAYGFSIRLMYGKLVLCHRTQVAVGQKLTIQTNLQVFFARKQKFINRLTADIDNQLKMIHDNEKTRTSIGVLYGNTQHNIALKNKRMLDSIFTNNNEHLQVYEDIKKFIANRKMYCKMNYPYKYAAILAGKPGTGKSSTILAIASELNRDVEYINLAVMTANTLIDRLNDSTDKKIFVFEDVDALNSNAFNERTADDVKSNASVTNQTCVINAGGDGGLKAFTLSLSDLLNITDGLLSSDGAVCIFTTNHIEKLDSALLRAGRMNKIVEFDYMNGNTANRMIEAYLGKEARLENPKDGIKPAELQEEILNIKLGIKDIASLKNFAKENENENKYVA